MYLLMISALLAFVLVAPARAQVHVDIGIHLPAPPQLVVVPEVRVVQYAAAPANLFFYGGQYWVFTNGAWYLSNGYRGPWIVVAPQFVPRPLLRVPVRYYRVPPGQWKKWHRREPPRWGDEWGREWAEHRGWKGAGRGGDRGDDHGGDRGDDHGEGRGRGRGHGR